MSKPAQNKSRRGSAYRREAVDRILKRLSEGEPLSSVTPLWEKPWKVAGIYLLLADGEPYYVGRSKNVARRFKQHLQPYYLVGCPLPKSQKTARALEGGRSVECAVIEVPEDLDEAEEFWIATLRKAGFAIKNVADGGAKETLKHANRRKTLMPWHPHQAPLQRALIMLRREAKRRGCPELQKKVDRCQAVSNKLKRNKVDWIAANLGLVVRVPAAKTWEGRIKVGDSWYG